MDTSFYLLYVSSCLMFPPLIQFYFWFPQQYFCFSTRHMKQVHSLLLETSAQLNYLDTIYLFLIPFLGSACHFLINTLLFGSLSVFGISPVLGSVAHVGDCYYDISRACQYDSIQSMCLFFQLYSIVQFCWTPKAYQYSKQHLLVPH